MNIRYGNGHGAMERNTHADTLTDAKSKVRTEAGRMMGGNPGNDVVFIRADDGVYAYLDQEDADHDEAGANAFAVIDNGAED